jgi:hypothetical protein
VTLAHALWVGTVSDDAGIALAYARTFAHGEGLRLTALSPRIEAYSDPLWVIWLSLGYVLRFDGPRFARVSGALCAAIAVAIVGFFGPKRMGRELRLLDALAPWLLALDTTYCYWAAAGLETGAFALALSIALVSGEALPAGLLGVLRPEGLLYAGALAVERKGSAARWLAVAVLPALLWLAFRRIYYGEWAPNAFFAKRNWDYGGPLYLAAWFRAAPWHWALAGAPLVLIERTTRRAAVPALAACGAAAAFVLVSRGDWMEEHRFIAHALPAAALVAGLVPAALGRVRGASAALGLALLAAAAWGAPSRSALRKRQPIVPLAEVARQARIFRDEADRVGLLHPRIAHFDIGGLALESGGEVVDLAGLADAYIGRIGYQSEDRVRDYVFDEVQPDMLDIHGPCAYLGADPRLERYYRFAASSGWGEAWLRKDDGCSSRLPELDGLEAMPPRELQRGWLCARARFPLESLPDVRPLARRLAREGLDHDDRDRLAAAVVLDPTLTRAARRLLEIRLAH